MNLQLAKLDGIDIGPREDAPSYTTSYDLIIPLVRKVTASDNTIKVKFLSAIRREVEYKCPLNKLGQPVVSDWDAFVLATPQEWANAIIKATNVKAI